MGLRGEHADSPFLRLLIDRMSSPVSLNALLTQESSLQFTSFNSDDALSLGLLLVENARPRSRPVVVDITLNGHQLFRHAMNGTTPDTAEWIRRENNTVNRFRHSSFYIGCLTSSQLDMYLVSSYPGISSLRRGDIFPVVDGIGS